jgi:hypothetical protein
LGETVLATASIVYATKRSAYKAGPHNLAALREPIRLHPTFCLIKSLRRKSYLAYATLA